MPRKTLHASDKEGFLRAFTDEWVDLAKEHQVLLEFRISPSHRAGVLTFIMTAYSTRSDEELVHACEYQCQYPTAAVESVEAALFRCSVQLERLLRSRRLQREQARAVQLACEGRE